MKNLVVIFALLLTSSFVYGQSEYKAENEGWMVDIDEAYEESKRTGKPIMANFTGSDWCGWCKRLTKSVFSQAEFEKWAEDNVVLLELDYPKRKSLPADIKKQNDNLRKAFGIRGYPTVWVFDADKNDKGEFNIDPIGKTGYQKSVGEFTGYIDRLMAARAN